MSKTLKILLIAGHGAGDPGACSNYGTESIETRRVVPQLKSMFTGYNASVDIYPTNRNAYADIGNGCCQVNFADYDYVFEVHFNSAASNAATGAEIWVTPAESGITVEQEVLVKMEALGFPNRGVKRDDFRVIRTAKNAGTSAALIEVCFINNATDMSRYNSKFNDVCKAMVDGIVAGFDIDGKGSSTVPSVPSIPNSTDKPKYYVRTADGKQLSAHNVYDYAVNMAKKNSAAVYDINGKLLVSYMVSSQEKRYAENGTFYFDTAVTVRTAPQENARTNVVYYPGESVIYHHVILNKNGFNWIEYARNNGTTGYLKVKDLSTDESYGYAK